MSEKKELYEQTSQYLHWRFTNEELARIRETNNRVAVERARENLAKEAQLRAQAAAGGDASSQTKHQFLSVDDELTLIDYYQQSITTYARLYNLPDQVKATAITFFKRFYVHNTVMDYPPKNIMATCVYLATKTENSFISIDDFVKPLAKSKITNEDVLRYEFVVSQSLQFEFAVHHPYRPAYGLYLDMQAYVQDLETLRRTFEAVKHYIQRSLHTDLCFHYMPSQIALAAWRLAASDTQLDIDQYLTAKFDAKSLNTLYQITDTIQDIIRVYQPAQKDTVREIDRRLFFTRNPAKNPQSLLYQKLQREEMESSNSPVKERPLDADDVFS
ncbi:hypothetical protein EV182_000651 [Spiromyces aspiralis]|uniref:Uncharacterized protein n=1 Tax=Spiromyces aspiralis TaxID=68401 RepID=A0ACC1HJ30_9FUNG|nr:hypothetical protein EV182_000651 [Spiromyces aspiralis]